MKRGEGEGAREGGQEEEAGGWKALIKNVYGQRGGMKGEAEEEDRKRRQVGGIDLCINTVESV